MRFLRKKGHSVNAIQEKFKRADGSTVAYSTLMKIVERDNQPRPRLLFESLDRALYYWFHQEREKGTAISQETLRLQAQRLWALMYPSENVQHDDALCIDEEEDITKTRSLRGFVHHFVNRHHIQTKTISGEALSADAEAAAHFVAHTFQNILSNFHPHQVYNMDETGLFFKTQFKRTLVRAGEKNVKGFKIDKSRVTLMLCSSMSGHRCPVVIIGHSANPRALSRAQWHPNNVTYRSSKNAWVTKDVFRAWLQDDFAPCALSQVAAVSDNTLHKVVLLLDNFEGHKVEPKDVPEGVELVFFPPNCTSLIQPQDQGVCHAFKKIYTKRLLVKYSGREDNTENFQQWCKHLDMHVLEKLVSQVWRDITPATLINCWNALKKKQVLCTPDTDEEVKELAAKTKMDPCVVGEMMQDTFHNAYLSEEQIAEKFAESEDKEDHAQEEEEVVEILQETDSHSEQDTREPPSQVRRRVEDLIRWFENEPNSVEHQRALREIRRWLVAREMQRAVQTDIRSYFSKVFDPDVTIEDCALIREQETNLRLERERSDILD